MDDGGGRKGNPTPPCSNRSSSAILAPPVRKIVESPAFVKALKARAGESLAKAAKKRIQFRDPASTDMKESAESHGHDSSQNEGQVLAPDIPVAESGVEKSKEKKEEKLQDSHGIGSSPREGRCGPPRPKGPAAEFETSKSKQKDLSEEVEKLRERRGRGSSQRQRRFGTPIPNELAAEFETSKSKQKDLSEAEELGKRHGRRDGSSKRKDPSWIPEWIEPDAKPDVSRPRARFSSRIKEKTEKQELAERIEAWRKKFVGEWESPPSDGSHGRGACKRKRSESEEDGKLDEQFGEDERAKRPKIVLRIAKEKDDSAYRVVSVSDGDEAEGADESKATKLVETSEAAKPSKDGKERKEAGLVRSPERVPSTEQKSKRKEKDRTGDPRPEKLSSPKKSSSSCSSSGKPEEKKRDASSAGHGHGRRHGQSKSKKSSTRPTSVGVVQKALKTPMMTGASSSGARSSVTATKDKNRGSQAHDRSTRKSKSDLPRLSTALTKDSEKLLKTPPGKKNSVHHECAAVKTKDGRLDSAVNGVDQPRKPGVSRAILRKGATGGPRSSKNSGSKRAVFALGKGQELPSDCSKDPVVDKDEAQDGGRQCEKISDKVDPSSTCQADGKIAESIKAIAAGNSWFDFPTPEDYEKMKLACEELIVENDDDGTQPSSGDATDTGSPETDDQPEKQAQEVPRSTLVEDLVAEKALTKAKEGDDQVVTIPGGPNADDPSFSPASFNFESPDFDDFREKLLEMLEKHQSDGFTCPAEPVVPKSLAEPPTRRASSSPVATGVAEHHETGDSRSSLVSLPVQSAEPKSLEKAQSSVSSRVMEDLRNGASNSPPRASMPAEKPINEVPFRKVQDPVIDQARSPLASITVIMAMGEPDERETFASIHHGDLPNVGNQQEKLNQRVVAPELPAAISVKFPVMDKPDELTKKSDQLPAFPVSSPVAITRAEKSDEQQMGIPVVKAASCPTVPVEKPIAAEPRSKLDKFLAQLKTPRPDKPRQTTKVWPAAAPYGNFPQAQQPPGPTPGEEWFSMDTIPDDTFFCLGQYSGFPNIPTEPMPLMQIQLEPPFAPPTEGIRRGLLGDHPKPWAPSEAPKRYGLLGDHPNPEGLPLAVHQRPLVHYDDIPGNSKKLHGPLAAPATSKKAAFSGDPDSPSKEDGGFGGNQQVGLDHRNLRPRPSRQGDEKPGPLGLSVDEKMLEGLSADEIEDLDNPVLRELREERVFESSNDYVRSLLRYFWEKPVGKFDGASLTFSPTFQVPSSELTILFEEVTLKKKKADAVKKGDVQWWAKFTEIYEIPLRQRQMEVSQLEQQQSRRFGLRGRDRKREKEKEDFENMKETLGKAAVEDNKTLHFYENEFPNEPSPTYIFKDELHEAIRKRELLSSIYQNVYKLPSKPDANICRSVTDSSARK